MRILIFVPKGYPKLGGSEVLAGHLARAFSGKGHVVTILAPRNGSQPARDQVEGIAVRRYGSPLPPERRSHVTGVMIPFLVTFARAVACHDAVLYLGCNRSVAWGTRLASSCGCAGVVMLQTGGEDGDLATFERAAGREALRALVSRVDHVTAVSDETAGELARYGVPDRKIVRIPNCIDLRRFPVLVDVERDRLKADLGFGGQRMLLAGGRMVPRKRLDRAVRIFHAVAPFFPDLMLCLSGDGPERPMLESLVRDLGLSGKVRFSTAPAETHWRHVAASDAYLHTADAEGLPLAVLEAMAAGSATVAPAIGGIVDVIGPGEGFLYEPASIEAAADAVRRALSPEAAEARRAARLKIERGYSSEKVADAYLALFAGAVRTGKGAGSPDAPH